MIFVRRVVFGLTSWRMRKDVICDRGLFAMGWIHFRRNLGVLWSTFSNRCGDLENSLTGGTEGGGDEDGSVGGFVPILRTRDGV